MSKPISKLKLGPRREVVHVEWNKMSPAEKVKYLDRQLADVDRCTKLLARFERLTERWLNNVKAQAAKK